MTDEPKSPYDPMPVRYVYAMESPSRRVIKVGYTNKPPVRQRRLRTRNGAEEVGDWRIVHTRPCANFIAAEKIAHSLLGPPAFGREYFAKPAAEVIEAIDAACDRVDYTAPAWRAVK